MIRQVINGVRFLVTGYFSSSQKVHPVESGLMRINLSPGGVGGGMDYYVSPASEEQIAAADALSDSMDMEELVSSPEEEDKIEAEQEEDGSPETNKISEDSDRCGGEFVLDKGGDGLDDSKNSDEKSEHGSIEPRGAHREETVEDVYASVLPVLGVLRTNIGRQDAKDDVFADSDDEGRGQEFIFFGEQNERLGFGVGSAAGGMRAVDDSSESQHIPFVGVRVPAQSFSSDDESENTGLSSLSSEYEDSTVSSNDGLSPSGWRDDGDDLSVTSVCTENLEGMPVTGEAGVIK